MITYIQLERNIQASNKDFRGFVLIVQSSVRDTEHRNLVLGLRNTTRMHAFCPSVRPNKKACTRSCLVEIRGLRPVCFLFEISKKWAQCTLLTKQVHCSVTWNRWVVARAQHQLEESSPAPNVKNKTGRPAGRGSIQRQQVLPNKWLVNSVVMLHVYSLLGTKLGLEQCFCRFAMKRPAVDVVVLLVLPIDAFLIDDR